MLALLSKTFTDLETGYRRIVETVNQIISAPKWTDATLLHGWVNFGNPFANAGYCQAADGRVYCRGLITSGTVADATVLFALPYAPPVAQVTVLTLAYNGTALSPIRIDIATNGNVLISGAASFAGSYYIALDNVSFSVSP